MRPKVVITHWVHPEVIELLSRHSEVVANSNRDTLPTEEIQRLARDADALLAFMPDIVDKEFLDACPRLKIVAAALKGYDNFDVSELNRRGIWFTMVPDLLTEPTAELAVALLLGLIRNLLPGDAFVRGGQFTGWRPELYGTGLGGRTGGILGLGAIGRAVAKRLAGFEMQLLYFDRERLMESQERKFRIAYTPLAELLSLSDFVILCVPLSADTFHLIDCNAIHQMKPGSYLVNVSRGSVVDEEAVGAALIGGHLSGYAADVFELEDSSRSNPPKRIPHCLIENRAQTLFTPHLGSAVDDVRRKVELRAASNILQALHGEVPKDAINAIVIPSSTTASSKSNAS